MVATRLVFACIAMAFFATPIGLAVLGVSGEEFENRRLAEPPKLTQGWSAFAQTTRYVIDHMPLRSQAVRVNTRIWTDAFATDPNYGASAVAGDQAIPFSGVVEQADGDLRIPKDGGLQGAATARTGSDGWAFGDMEFEAACDESVPDRERLEGWAELVEAVQDDGRQAAVFIAPSKASVYPEHLPDEYPFDHCALDAKDRFWRLLAREGASQGVVELRSKLLRLKVSAGDNLFYRLDTHWTTLGALVLVEAALEAVGDGVRLEPEEIVDRGRVAYTGDLSVATGNPTVDTRDEYGVDRAPGARRVPGRTLLVCDSFAYKWMRLFRAYFDDVHYTYWNNPDRIAKEIRRSDTVIFEANETWLKLQPDYATSPRAVARKLAAQRR